MYHGNVQWILWYFMKQCDSEPTVVIHILCILYLSYNDNETKLAKKCHDNVKLFSTRLLFL